MSGAHRLPDTWKGRDFHGLGFAWGKNAHFLRCFIVLWMNFHRLVLVFQVATMHAISIISVAAVVTLVVSFTISSAIATRVLLEVVAVAVMVTVMWFCTNAVFIWTPSLPSLLPSSSAVSTVIVSQLLSLLLCRMLLMPSVCCCGRADESLWQS